MNPPKFSNTKVIRSFVDSLVLCLLIFGAFFTYRYGIVAIPRGDIKWFFKIRELFRTDWEYFWHMTFLSHHHDPLIEEQAFLFRPLYFGLYAISEIMFRSNLFLFGAISITLHAFIVCLFYLLISRFISRSAAFIFSVFLLTQYTGVEMVYWRGAGFYLIGFFFFLIGLLMICKANYNDHFSAGRTAATILSFLCAALSHELFMMLLLLQACLLYFLSKRGGKENVPDQVTASASLKKLSIIIGLPFIIYILLDIFSICYFHPKFFSPNDHVHYMTSINLLIAVIRLSGLFGIAFMFPSKVHLTLAELSEHQAAWDFDLLSRSFEICVGFFLIICLFFTFFYILKQFLKKDNKSFLLAGIMMLIYFATLVMGLVVGRVVLRGFEYMKTATYYNYFSNFALISIVAVLYCLIESKKEKISKLSNVIKWSGLLAILIYTSWQVIYNYGQIQRFIKPHFELENNIASSVLKISHAIKKHPHYCYGGSFTGRLWLVPELYLYHESCVDKDGREPVYGFLTPDNFLQLKSLNANSGMIDVHDLQGEKFDPIDAFDFLPDLKSQSTNLQTVYLSRKTYDLIYLDIKIQNAIAAGLILGFQDDKNYTFILFRDFEFYLFIVKDGKVIAGSISRPYYWNKEDFRLTFEKLDDNYAIFYEHNIVMFIPNSKSLKGKVGFFTLSKGKVKPSFAQGTLFELNTRTPNTVSPFFFQNVKILE